MEAAMTSPSYMVRNIEAIAEGSDMRAHPIDPVAAEEDEPAEPEWEPLAGR
jgi:hypothetical protein